MTDREYMERAIELAGRGRGWTNPNPLVGAVIVKNGRVIGEGWHARWGELHAERNAIRSLRESAEGATLYVTLEPCCHYGRTPPCTEAILEQKIARVVIGSRDPNPKVSGKGAAILRQAGVTVEEDFMREACDRLNPDRRRENRHPHRRFQVDHRGSRQTEGAGTALELYGNPGGHRHRAGG